MKRIRIFRAFSKPYQIVLTILFSIFFFSAPSLLSFLPLDRATLIERLSSPNLDFPYLFTEIYEKKEDLDWVFLGPCTVWWQIFPEEFEAGFKQKSGKNIVAANLAFNHFGADLGDLLIRELVNYRSVKNVVLATPRATDGNSFPHPEVYSLWLPNKDRHLVSGLSPVERFKFYSAEILSSFKKLRYFVGTSPKPTRGMSTEKGTKQRQGVFAPLAFRPIPSNLSKLIVGPTELGQIGRKVPWQSIEKKIFLETILFLQNKGIRVWLINTPLIQDFADENLSEREDWGSQSTNVSLVGVPPGLFKKAYPEVSSEGFFLGDNLSPAAGKVFSRWIGQALGEYHGKL